MASGCVLFPLLVVKLQHLYQEEEAARESVPAAVHLFADKQQVDQGQRAANACSRCRTPVPPACDSSPSSPADSCSPDGDTTESDAASPSATERAAGCQT